MSTTVIVWLVIVAVVAVFMGAIFYFRKPGVQTPQAVKDIEDRTRAAGRKLEDDVRDKYRSKK